MKEETMTYHAFLIKYAEIAIKGKNRGIFEEALANQIKIALKRCHGEFHLDRSSGRMYVHCPEVYDFDEVVENLKG